MGLDGFVRCNCFPDHLRTPPPCPVEWLSWEENSLVLLPERDTADLWLELDGWAGSACPHPDFRVVGVRVGNRPTLAFLRDTLAELGGYPILAGLPRCNEGQLPWQKAGLGLEELSRFRQLDGFGVIHELMGPAGRVRVCVPSYGGIFCWSGPDGVNAGIDGEGLFLLDRRTQGCIFRARRCEQVESANGRTLWRNLDTEETCETDFKIEDNPLWTQTRVVTPNEFAPTLDALDKLFKAAVQVRQPVQWC